MWFACMLVQPSWLHVKHPAPRACIVEWLLLRVHFNVECCLILLACRHWLCATGWTRRRQTVQPSSCAVTLMARRRSRSMQVLRLQGVADSLDVAAFGSVAYRHWFCFCVCNDRSWANVFQIVSSLLFPCRPQCCAAWATPRRTRQCTVASRRSVQCRAFVCCVFPALWLACTIRQLFTALQCTSTFGQPDLQFCAANPTHA